MTETKAVMSRLSEKKSLHIIILLSISSLLVFYNLGENSFVGGDEAFYALIVKEIIRTGDWLTPHIEDEIAYSKPPLILWLMALSSSVLGFSEFSIRLPSAIFGILTVVLTYLFTESLYNRRTALLASVMILTCSHFIYDHSSKTGEMDSAITFFILLSAYCIWKSKQSKRYFYLSWGAMGLVFMTKAIAFIIPMGIVILYLLLSRRIRDFSIGQWAAGIGVFLLISLPWHMHQLIINPGTFVDLYLRDQVMGRPMESETFLAFYPLHYIKIILRGFFPWSFILPFAVIYNIIGSFKKKQGFKGTNLIFIYVFVVWVICSSISKRFSWYIMPIYPAFAILNGRFLLNYLGDITGRRIFSFFLAGMLLSLMVITADVTYNPFMIKSATRLMAVDFSNTFMSFYRKSPGVTIFVFLFTWFLTGIGVHAVLTRTERKLPGSSKKIADILVACFVTISLIIIFLPLRFSDYKSFFCKLNKEIWVAENSDKLLILYGNNMPHIKDYIYLYNFRDLHRQTVKFIELDDAVLLQAVSSDPKNMFLMERQHYYDIRHRENFRGLFVPIREWNNYVLLSKGAEKGSGSGGSEQILQEIKNLQDYSSPKICVESARTLGRLGDRSAVKHLLALLGDPDSDIVAAAAKALGDLRDPVASGPLREALTRYKENDRTYLTIALSLAYLRDRSSIDFLAKLLKDHPIYSLHLSRGPEIIIPREYGEHNKFWTGYLLMGIEPAVARDVILENVLDYVVTQQKKGIVLSTFNIRNQTLFRLGNRHALDFIEHVLNDQDIWKRKIAVYLLCKPSGASTKMTPAEMDRAQNLLRRIGEDDNSEEIRTLARKILARYHREAWVAW